MKDFLFTKEDAKKKLDELKNSGPHSYFSDESKKILILDRFLELDEHIDKLLISLKISEEFRDKVNKEIRTTKNETKKLELIEDRNLKNKYLRMQRKHMKEQTDKLKFYAYEVSKILRGVWKKEDLPDYLR